jgi:hypothetical protein
LNVKASRLVVASVIAESSLQGDLHFRDRESPEACEPTAPLSGDEDDEEFEPEAYIPAHQEGLMPGRQKLAAQSEILTRIGAQVRRFTPGSVPRVINPAAIKVLLENEARIHGRHWRLFAREHPEMAAELASLAGEMFKNTGLRVVVYGGTQNLTSDQAGADLSPDKSIEIIQYIRQFRDLLDGAFGNS